jgi:hypothetical protein
MNAGLANTRVASWGGQDYNQNWAGYTQYSNNWIQADSYWTEPTAVCQTNLNATASTWVGIGGDGNTRLVQTGSEENMLNLVGICHTSYYAWVENLGNVPGTPGYNSNYNNLAYNVFSINHGDRMYSSIDQKPGDVFMFIEDMTTDTYYGVAFGPTPNPGTFECIHEKHTDGHVLTETNSIPFSNCEGEHSDGSFHWMGDNNYTYDQEIITTNGGSSGTLEAAPSSISSGGNFSVIWYHN